MLALAARAHVLAGGLLPQPAIVAGFVAPTAHRRDRLRLHGGRQFDSQPATIDVLPSIMDAVGGRAEVYLDGGIRRGQDIVKAVALGAKAALAGRPFAYALATDGKPPVDRVFGILQEEFKGALGFVGKSSVADLDSSIFAATSPAAATESVLA